MDTDQHTRERDRINDMVREHHAAENLELRERVSDLVDERDVYRFWWQETLHALANITTKYGRRQEDYQRLQDEVRDLRAMVVAECYADADAVMGTTPYGPIRGLPDRAAIEARP